MNNKVVTNKTDNDYDDDNTAMMNQMMVINTADDDDGDDIMMMIHSDILTRGSLKSGCLTTNNTINIIGFLHSLLTYKTPGKTTTTYLFDNSSNYLSIHPLIHSFIHQFIQENCSFICSSILFLYIHFSFVHLFTHPLTTGTY